MKKSNTPGLVLFALQSIGLIAGSAATSFLSQHNTLAAIATAALTSVALLMFFPSLHESGHRTAFATKRLNDVVCWISAILMLQSPSFFREFHGQHHRETQDPETDPEICEAPEYLDGWPPNVVIYLGLACGQLLMMGKLMFTAACSLIAGEEMWTKLFPFIRARKRAQIARESRLVLLVLTAITAAGITWVPGFGYVLLAWPLAHLWLGFYLMPEHTGLPNDGSQLHRTRTVKSNALVRWMMWNMPYHALHHAHPAIPFHAVPEANARIADDLEHVSSGYIAFHIEALGRSLGLWRDPTPGEK